MTEAELRALLADCLMLWGVAGRAAATGDGVVIEAAAGTVRIAPADPALRPVRWFVRTPELVAAGRPPRAAASIAAVLGVVRAAVSAQ